MHGKSITKSRPQANGKKILAMHTIGGGITALCVYVCRCKYVLFNSKNCTVKDKKFTRKMRKRYEETNPPTGCKNSSQLH